MRNGLIKSPVDNALWYIFFDRFGGIIATTLSGITNGRRRSGEVIDFLTDV